VRSEVSEVGVEIMKTNHVARYSPVAVRLGLL
jgi:hypothetical protein